MTTKGNLKLSLFVALILVVMLIGSVAATASAQAPARMKVLIAFTHQPGPAEQALVRGVGGDIKYTYHLVPAIAAAVPEVALDGLRHHPLIVAVEPDLEAHVIDAELDSAWGVKRIGAGAVHAQGNWGTGVKVGILDTGIDLDHPDLAYDPACSVNYIEGESLDDGHSHGTHVAGTIAGLDDDNGVVGVAPEATLCIYKVFGSSGSGDYSDIIAALERAVSDGVQITNNSYGSSADPGATVQAAFDNAYAAGVLHVGASGNYGNFSGTGENCIYPALWDAVMATAATTQSDTRATFSSTCPEVEIAAPGDLIYSTMPGGVYGYKSGTSMASPHVAGTAALVLAAYPGWSNGEVRTQLQTTADDLGVAGRDPWYGYGLIDALEAAGSPSTNLPPVADDQNVITDEDIPIGITLTGSDPDGDPLTYSVADGPANGTLSGTAPDVTYTPDPDYNGPDSFTFVANDGQADSNIATVSITVHPVNDPPAADDQAVTTAEDTPVAITLTASDVDGDPLSYSVVAGPANGALSGTVPDLTYTPDLNYHGSDSFTFVANDGTVDSNVATVSITVTPVNDAPVATFTYACAELACDFASTSSDPDGTIAGYSWDFGDGQTSSGATASHSFAAAGSYQVILTVTDNDDATGTDTQTVTVSDAAPSMHVGDLDGSLVSANKNFWWAEVTITVHDQGEGPVASATVQGIWSGGASGSGSCLSAADGICTVLSPKIPIGQGTIAFVVDGVAHATLPYQPADNHDPDGGDGTSIVVSQFGNQSPVAAFTYSCAGLTCDFDGSASSDADGVIVSYAWDWGDGSTGSGVTASHTYGAGGAYTVILTVTDDDGASDSDTQSMTVSEGSGGLTLTASGYKVKGVQHADLAWSGASSSHVDVYRDGAKIDTTANDGTYTDNIGTKGGGSYIYQVCESGTATCSNEATVTF